jgi:aryl-alcohol dehydrogenase-like predicted oxidoreductase
MTTPSRPLGASGLKVGPIGLGAMGLSEFYGEPAPEGEAINLIHLAIDEGIDHIDTAEMYGVGRNESLVGKALRGRRDRVVLATKFGPQRDPETGARLGIDGSPECVRRSIEGSLSRLGVETVDLYYLHRVDPDTPIEETVGAMARLVEEGKVRALGLSEASAETLRRACAVHPIAALQSEYSLFSRDIEESILPACRELNVSLVAYSPLGRGILTGRWSGGDDRPSGEGEFRTGGMQPRYAPDNFNANLKLVEVVKEIAARHKAMPAQIALAWVLSRGEDVVTIPGTTRRRHLESNLSALQVKLDPTDLERLESLAAHVKGERYSEDGMKWVNG